VYLEDYSGDDGSSDYLDRHVAKEDENPEHILGDVRMRAALVEAIKVLPEREQYIMSMYYEHDMNLKEIAAVLGRDRITHLSAAQPVDSPVTVEAA
jgi:RNA polymerase sigma factor for flagellar operon FliA